MPPNAGRENSSRDVSDSPVFLLLSIRINVESWASHTHAVGIEHPPQSVYLFGGVAFLDRLLARDPFDGVTLVPDRRDDGTNVLRLPAGSDFHFTYGPGSFRAHRAEATRLGLPVRVLRLPALAYDVDWPADVVELGLAT